MDSLVKPRPNHYELLGLTPAATDAEIARAFAREISPLTPHAFGDIALLSVAHETLRDHAKRRAYDESLGLNVRPKPVQPLQGWQYRTTVRLGSPAAVSERPAKTEAPAPQAKAPAPERPPAPKVVPRRDWIPPRPIPIQHIRPVEDERAEWKRPAIVAGGIFGGVALLGVLAGLWAARDVQSKSPPDALEIETPAQAAVGPPPAAETKAPEPKPAVAAAPAIRTRQKAAQPQPVKPEEQRAEDVPDIPTEQVAVLTSQPDEPQASMPLSNATVARTIGRIGYSCGKVASTSAVEGSPGVFKVTCTSGQSYRAAPVGGRYRFRKWGG